MTETIATLETLFTSNTRDFERGMARADKSITNMGKQITGLGKDLTMKLSLPMAAVGAAATGMAIQWESDFAGVIKTVDGTADELNQLGMDLRALATDAENPVSSLANAHSELAGIAEAAGQLGVELPYIVDFSEQMAILGMATDLTAENAAFMSAQFANITGMSFDNIDNFSATIVGLGNNLATTESQILEMAQRMAGVASTAGLTEAEILGWAGALTSVGINAEAGGSAFSRVLSDITQAVALGGEELNAFADVAGMAADDFAEMWRANPSDALFEFIEGLSELDAEARELALAELGLDGIRVADMLRRLSNNTELVNGSLEMSSEFWEENNAQWTEAQKRADTTAGKMAMLRNKVNDLGITLGNELIPPLTVAIGWLADMADKLATANPELFRIAAFAILAGIAIGPLTTVLGGLVTVIGGITTALFAFNGALLLALGPIAIAAGLFYAYETNLYGFKDAIDSISTQELIGIAFGVGAVAFAVTNLGLVTGIATTAVYGMSGALALLLGPVGLILLTVGLLGAAWATNFGGMRDWVDDIRDNMESNDVDGLVWNIIEAVEALPKTIVGAEKWEEGVKGWNTTWESIQAIINWIGEETGKLLGSINFTLPPSLREMFNVVNGIYNTIRSIMGMSGGANGMQFQSSGFGIGGTARELEQRAAGGPVSAGTSYLVGERGPELFQPRRSGRIVSNDALMGGGSSRVIVMLDGAILYDALVDEGGRRGEVVAVVS